MGNRQEQDQIKAILVQAIANICRKGLTYSSKFSIEGLLGITLDEEDIFLVNIKETVHQSGYYTPAHTKRDKATLSANSALQLQGSVCVVSDKTASSIQTIRGNSPHPEKRISLPGTSISKKRQLYSESDLSPLLKRNKPLSDYDNDQPQDLSLTKVELEVILSDSDQKRLHENEADSCAPDTADSQLITSGGSDAVEERFEQQRCITIQPTSQRRLWERSRKSKPRKSQPRKIESVPVFPELQEQDGGEPMDFGRFLSMKPILRDIDNSEPDDHSSGEAISTPITKTVFATYQDSGSNLYSTEEKDDDSHQDSSQLYINMENEMQNGSRVEEGYNTSITTETDPIDSSPSSQQVYANIEEVVTDGQNMFRCTLCDIVFPDRPLCQRHMRWQHKTKVYNCDMCGKRFWHQSEYTEHKAVFHEGPGGYPCEHCGKVLLSKRGLKEHMQHHTGQYPFFCVKCNRGFGRKFEYNGHRRKHHPDEVE